MILIKFYLPLFFKCIGSYFMSNNIGTKLRKKLTFLYFEKIQDFSLQKLKKV